MPIIKQTSNLEKVSLLYKGKKSVLDRTNLNSDPAVSRMSLSINQWFKYTKPKANKFESNDQLFSMKFKHGFPEIPLKATTLYLKRKSQMTPFIPKKVSREDLEKILKWGLFYNEKEKRFTVPCGGGLYHYEIFFFLFRSFLLPLGLYRYNPQSRTLGLIRKGDFMESAVDLFDTYLDRLKTSSGVMMFTSNLSESRAKYDYRSERFILLDTGHLMHSMNLAFTSAGYGVSNIGGGKDKKIIKFLGETGRLRYISCLYFGGRDPDF